MAGDGTERRLFRGFPYDGISADPGESGVPSPDGHRKIERGDDPNWAERMPLLGQPMSRPLGGDCQTVKLAAQANRKVADVDDLLNLTECFLCDLARFPTDDRRKL